MGKFLSGLKTVAELGVGGGAGWAIDTFLLGAVAGPLIAPAVGIGTVLLLKKVFGHHAPPPMPILPIVPVVPVAPMDDASGDSGTDDDSGPIGPDDGDAGDWAGGAGPTTPPTGSNGGGDDSGGGGDAGGGDDTGGGGGGGGEPSFPPYPGAPPPAAAPRAANTTWYAKLNPFASAAPALPKYALPGPIGQLLPKYGLSGPLHLTMPAGKPTIKAPTGNVPKLIRRAPDRPAPPEPAQVFVSSPGQAPPSTESDLDLSFSSNIKG